MASPIDLDVPVMVVRAIFAVLAGSGIGFLAYIALWVLVPVDVPGQPRCWHHTGRGGGPRCARWSGTRPVAIVVSGVLGIFGGPFGGARSDH